MDNLKTKNIKQEIENLENAGKDVCKYLAYRKRDEYEKQIIYKKINEFVSDSQRGGLYVSRA